MAPGRVFGTRGAAAAVCLAALAFAGPATAQRKVPVDLALVLAVDVSGSMDEDEQALQRQGYADAFKHPNVISAIRDAGASGRIAVAYVEWSEVANTTIDWTLIGGAKDAQAFAARLASEPIARGRRTSISGGLQAAMALIDSSPYFAARRVIDISGDGANNSGEPVEQARDAAVADNITINGLPIVLEPPRPFDAPDLEAYYRDCVKGGRGAFVLGIRSLAEMAGTIRNKLVTEIAGLDRHAHFVPAQARAQEKADCLVGEKNRRFDGGFRRFDFNGGLDGGAGGGSAN
jgi:Protein of unknown function (DUF1194)